MGNKQIKIKNKERLIIAICIFLVILILLPLFIIFNFQKQNKLLSKKDSNILYYNENEFENENKGDDDVIVVNVDDENETYESQPTNEEKPKNEETKPKVQNIPYYIKINNKANTVTVYKKDAKGEYTVPIKAMICSIGDATPESGVFSISDKYTWRFLQGDVYGQYACRITGHILFHSVPYTSQDKSTLEWWEYDKLGEKASLGCIRLKVEDAKWIYDNCVSGTKVEFYSDSNPGPLGKPTARKISDDEEVRNWDPTDPDKNNPWNEYLKRKEENKKQEEDNKQEEKNQTKEDIVVQATTNSVSKDNTVIDNKNEVANEIKETNNNNIIINNNTNVIKQN